MSNLRRILLLTLLLPITSLLAYWGGETLPTGPIPYILGFLVILPNFIGLQLVYAFFPPCMANPADAFHMIAGIILNWLVLTAILTIIWTVVSMRQK